MEKGRKKGADISFGTLPDEVKEEAWESAEER
jgi:aryl carrier-like protein